MQNLGRAGSVALRHIHLPSDIFSHSYPTYTFAAALQSRLQRELLDSKSALSNSSGKQSPTPPPTIISFTPPPVYTLGRRQSVGPDVDVAALYRPLTITHPQPSFKASTLEPTVLRSLRGGLTTYHGPGQVVIWPVIDLQPASGGYESMGVREYADLLQDVTADVVKQSMELRERRLRTVKTCDPGVWIDSEEEATTQPRKIAAMGVHLRRHVAGLGVALNLTTAGTASNVQSGRDGVNDETNNPWLRFVPCGLAGKDVTSVFLEARSQGADAHPNPMAASKLVSDPDPGRSWARAWTALFAQRLRLEGYEAEIPFDMEKLAEEAKSIETEMRVGCVGDGASKAALANA